MPNKTTMTPNPDNSSDTPRTAILVVGMHRSGTSAIARTLNLRGADLGLELIPPKADNETGFWENRAFLQLHETLLAKLGLKWHQPVALPNDWRQQKAARTFVSDLTSELGRQFPGQQPFVVKDPRLSLLAPLWLEALNNFGASPRFVLPVRHPAEIAASLEQRDQLPVAQSHALYLMHLMAAERSSRHHPRVFVHYENLLHDVCRQMDRVSHSLAIDWPDPDAERNTEIKSFIKSSLRHHRVKDDAALLPKLLQQAYDLVCAASKDRVPENSDFDLLWTQANSVMQLLGPSYNVWTNRLNKLEQHYHDEIARASTAQRSSAQECSALRATVAAKDAEIEAGQAAFVSLATDVRKILDLGNSRVTRKQDHRSDTSRESTRSRTNLPEATHIADATQIPIRTVGGLAKANSGVIAQNLMADLQQHRTHEKSLKDNLSKQISEQEIAMQCMRSAQRDLWIQCRSILSSKWFRAGRSIRILHEASAHIPSLPTNLDSSSTTGPLIANIDSPTPRRTVAGRTRVSGWCTHATQLIKQLAVVIGNQRHECAYGLERQDVASVFPDVDGSAFSGFEATIHTVPGIWPIDLVATLENGSEARLCMFDILDVHAPPRAQRVARHTRNAIAIWRYGIKHGRTWIRENRGLPWPHEIPKLVAVARDQIKRQRLVASGSDPVGFGIPDSRKPYDVWQQFNAFGAAARKDLVRRLDAASNLPLLSVVMPVFNAPVPLLRDAIESVRQQVYQNWELCIADDASTDGEIRTLLADQANSDDRIRVCWRSENGNISAATNSAAELARGKYLVFLDQDDLLAPNALAEVALCAAERPDADLIYTDDDKISVDGHRYAPQFKPDWSPELLLSYMYLSHMLTVRRSLFIELGGMRQGYEGSQDYDFALRASEQTDKVAHIPQVLYHWRALPGSTATSGAAKSGSIGAGLKAVQDALDRRNVNAHAFQPSWARKAAVGIFDIEFPDHGPPVSILIPTRNNLSVLRRCIDSIARTTYRDYEVMIIDNGSDDPETIAYLEQIPHRVERIVNPARTFNFAHINNRAAEMVQGKLLVFLNNDTEIIAPQWLSQMVGLSRMDGIGAVGARLTFPDKRIQHAGIIHGLYNGLAGPAFKLLPEWDNGYLSYARVTRNYSAVTAACMLTPRKLFLDMGGFDEGRFAVAYNDVDYCYRLAALGLRAVYCARAGLLHYEGHSRGFCDRPQEIAQFRHLYGGKRDPYYSPHLSLANERFELQPRRFRPHPGPAVRALMCAFNLNLEGAPYSQLELTLGLMRSGLVSPEVYSPQDGPLRQAYEKAGIKVHVFEHPLTGVADEKAYEAALDRFGAFLKGLDVDVVYGNTMQTFYAIDAGQRAGLATLWNPRESEPWRSYFSYLPAPLAARALACFQYPYRVIFVANATRLVWQELESHHNFTVIHNGLNLARLSAEADRFPRSKARQELGIKDDEVAILLPGTVCERKGQQELIRAIALLPVSATGTMRCFIVGDRPNAYSTQLHALADGLPRVLNDRVEIVPENRDIAKYYQAADIFVCTSRVESFPRVILEAMAYGLPIVTTNVFGIAEQVQEDINALMYEPGDVQQFASHLQALLCNDELRFRLADNSKAVLVRINTFEEMVASYAEIFQEAALCPPATVPGKAESADPLDASP